MKKALFIASVWPEPRSSAAGLRTRNLIDLFLRHKWQLVFVSTCKDSAYRQELHQTGIRTEIWPLNDSTVDRRIQELKPDLVLYDRFIMQEQFGWRISENSPRSFQCLDTSDLHFLRRAREKSVNENQPVDLHTEDCWRELAAIHQSDLALVMSSFERDLLINEFSIPAEQIELLRFFYPIPREVPSFDEREGIMFIGNFRHAPNRDALFWFLAEVWPSFEGRFKFFVYGAYAPREISNLHSPEKGIFVRGRIPDQFAVMRSHRALAAPLRFGAGIKGKISDSWYSGIPVVTSAAGAEGMTDGKFAGLVCSTVDEWISSIQKLMTDPAFWLEPQKRGIEIIKSEYSIEKQGDALMTKIEDCIEAQDKRRRQNIFGQILKYRAFRATEYLSRWIEQKNKSSVTSQ